MRKVAELVDDDDAPPRPQDEDWTVVVDGSPNKFPSLTKFAVYFGSALVILLLVVAVAPILAPASMTIATAERLTGEIVGSAVRIKGAHSFRILPSLRLEANDIEQIPTPGRVPAFTMKRLEVDISAIGLPFGSIDLERVFLIEPRLTLGANDRDENAPVESPEINEAWGFWRDMSLAAIMVQNAEVRVAEPFGGSDLTLTHFDLRNVEPKAGEAVDGLTVTGSGELNGEKVDLRATASDLQLLVTGNRWPVSTTITSKHLSAMFDGSLAVRDRLSGDGKVAIKSDDAAALDAWIGQVLPFRPGNRLALNAKVDFIGDTLDATQLQIKLGETSVSGQLRFSRVAGETPRIQGSLQAETFDFGGVAGASVTTGSDAPFAPFLMPDGKIELSWQRALWRSYVLGAGRASIERMPGTQRVTMTVEDCVAYGGKLRGSLILDASEGMRALQADGKAVGVEIGAVLGAGAMTAQSPLSGTGTIDVNLFSVGGSPKQMIEALNGQADVTVFDGGLNMPTLVDGVGGGRRFAALNGTLSIAQGIAETDDLIIRAENISLIGKGHVDLSNWNLDLTVGRLGTGTEGKSLKHFRLSGPAENIQVEAIN